jgi:hypothetical protein
VALTLSVVPQNAVSISHECITRASLNQAPWYSAVRIQNNQLSELVDEDFLESSTPDAEWESSHKMHVFKMHGFNQLSLGLNHWARNRIAFHWLAFEIVIIHGDYFVTIARIRFQIGVLVTGLFRAQSLNF